MLSYQGMQRWNSNLQPITSQIRRNVLQIISQIMLLIGVASLFTAIVFMLWFIATPDAMRSAYFSGAISFSTANQLNQTTPQRPLVGIVAGHAGYDPGAVCLDGLTEAEINLAIAQEVVKLLHSRNVDTDLLEEFDTRLTNYQADALVSIHADSCNVPGATGFKVARVTLSAIPEAEDQLVNCLITEYSKITRLPEHTASITDNMTDYHAFREIASLTPGAIIETGFLLEDRAILERNPRLVARGIAAGILCFLNNVENG